MTFSTVSFYATILGVIVLSILLFIAGKVLVTDENAELRDAFLVTVVGSGVGFMLTVTLNGTTGALASLIAWLIGIKTKYYTSWAGAFVIALLMVAVYIGLAVGLAVYTSQYALTFLS